MNASTTAMTRRLLLIALAALATACGGKDEEGAASGDAPPAAAQPATPGGAEPADVAPGEERMANAVVTSKTAAAVDLKYDMQSKPDVGQPFEIELVSSGMRARCWCRRMRPGSTTSASWRR